MTGFYLMHRGWMDHDAFEKTPFSEREAWVWMIENARWEDGVVNVLGSPVMLRRGQLSHSLRFMAGKFRWSKAKMEHFLAKLKKFEMCRTDNRTGQLVVTICNYSKYQDRQDRQQDSQQDTNRTATGQQQDKEEINKQVNKDTTLLTRAREADPEAVRDAFRAVYDEGTAMFPQLAPKRTEVINRWLEAGADPERDILPEMRRHLGKNIQSWGYFSGGVMDAVSTRTRPLPQGRPRSAATIKPDYMQTQMEAAARAVMPGKEERK